MAHIAARSNLSSVPLASEQGLAWNDRSDAHAAAGRSACARRSSSERSRHCDTGAGAPSVRRRRPRPPRRARRRRVRGARCSRGGCGSCEALAGKISGRMNGTCLPRSAFCRLNKPFRRLALRLARTYGLSRNRGSTAFGGVHCQVPASPVIRPGQPFSSTRKIPLRARTRTSTSLTVPSTRNSKFAHARNGSLSGRRALRNAKPSRSQGYSDGVTWTQASFIAAGARWKLAALTATLNRWK